MLGVECWRRRKMLTSPLESDSDTGFEDLTPGKSVMIGCFQCLALWPGMSRSMTTIIGGYLVGLSPECATKFSFLLGLITLTAASGYTLVMDGSEMLAALRIGPVLVGCFISFASAAIAVKWLVGFLSKHGLALFAWYRIALAVAIFALLK